jgi:hypothetical protein
MAEEILITQKINEKIKDIADLSESFLHDIYLQGYEEGRKDELEIYGYSQGNKIENNKEESENKEIAVKVKEMANTIANFTQQILFELFIYSEKKQDQK